MPLPIDHTSRGPSSDAVTLEALSLDPYTVYAELRERAPVIWAPGLKMWLVTRYEDVKSVLTDASTFANDAPQSLIFKTFGANMLCADGSAHRRYRPPELSGAFMPRTVRARFHHSVENCIANLIASFKSEGCGDLRPLFASRLPVLVMLDVFGLNNSDEPYFRAWYNHFEAALSNHHHDPNIEKRAAQSVKAFHDYFQARINEERRNPKHNLLSDFLAHRGDPLNDEELRRNALIIFFGGISTVEALILNTLWTLFEHKRSPTEAFSTEESGGAVLTETLRWLSPVQSATRHATRDIELAGAHIKVGDTVNCMLGAANRDPAVFSNPDAFDPERANNAKHLAFAIGPHLCLGRHLAILEASMALHALVKSCPELRLLKPVHPEGHEFRQPRSLPVEWGCVDRSSARPTTKSSIQ